MAFLPKKYAIGQNLAHLEHVRPLANAIGLALQQDESQEGLRDPMSSGPDGAPSVLRRLSIKKVGPKLENPPAFRFHR